MADATSRVLLVSSWACAEHDQGTWHPESPARLRAVIDGAWSCGIDDALVPVHPRPATLEELARVTDAGVLGRLAATEGSGVAAAFDPETVAGPGSWAAILAAAGAGLDAVARLDAGEAEAAFCAVRPPGHHAEHDRAFGFCFVNNVAVTAAALADRGERVLIVDYDAHHGNGTQDTFWDDPRVAYVSIHQWPLFPGTGRHDETGGPAARGLTVNVPLPPGASAVAARAAFDEVIVPLAERFRPTWLVVSAGFDAHRMDPMAQLQWSAGDYADLTGQLVGLVPPGRVVAFLEGGYDLDALEACAGAAVSALAGAPVRVEPASSGDRGLAVVGVVRAEVEAAWADSPPRAVPTAVPPVGPVPDGGPDAEA